VNTPDPETVRAWTIQQGLAAPDDTSEVTPPEYRAYANWAAHKERMAELDKEQERKRRDMAQVAREREYQAQVKTHAGRVRMARAWGQQHGYPVAQRGRVPARVMSAFLAAVEQGTLVTTPPEFQVGERVTQPEDPQRVGTIRTVEPDPYSGQYVYGVQWQNGGRIIPYRTDLQHTHHADDTHGVDE
jgi:hypothetical protein